MLTNVFKQSPFSSLCLSKVMALLVVCIIAGCSQPKNKASGGEDAGAGNTTASSADEVRSTILNIWNRFRDPEQHEAVQQVVASVVNANVPLDAPENKKIEEMGQAIVGGWSKNLPQAHEYLKKSELKLVENGSCEVRGGIHSDASVSKFAHGATICFSISNLRRVPSHSLVIEVLALLFHEMAHLNGYGEEDAEFIQKAILRNSAEYFHPQFPRSRIHQIKFVIERTNVLTELMVNRINTNPNDPALRFSGAQIAESVMSLMSPYTFGGLSTFALSPRDWKSFWKFHENIFEMFAFSGKVFPSLDESFRSEPLLFEERNPSVEMTEYDPKNPHVTAAALLSIQKKFESDFILYVQKNFPDWPEEKFRPLPQIDHQHLIRFEKGK